MDMGVKKKIAIDTKYHKKKKKSNYVVRVKYIFAHTKVNF